MNDLYMREDEQENDTHTQSHYRTLSFLREVSRLILREKESHGLIEKVCLQFTATGGFENACIILVDSSEQVIDVAQSGVLQKNSALRVGFYLSMTSNIDLLPNIPNSVFLSKSIAITNLQTCNV